MLPHRNGPSRSSVLRSGGHTGGYKNHFEHRPRCSNRRGDTQKVKCLKLFIFISQILNSRSQEVRCHNGFYKQPALLALRGRSNRRCQTADWTNRLIGQPPPPPSFLSSAKNPKVTNLTVRGAPWMENGGCKGEVSGGQGGGGVVVWIVNDKRGRRGGG